MLVKISLSAINSLLSLSGDRTHIKKVIAQVEGMRADGAIRMHKSPQGISFYVDAAQIIPALNASSGLWVAVDSSTSVRSNAEWDYQLMPQKDGHASATDGLQDNGSTAYPGKNTWEDPRLTNAGYENGSVTGLCKIPDGAIVWARWQLVNTEVKLIFSERNEPKCD